MALSAFVCGATVDAGGGGTLEIPITTDVPRSDPTLGATIILVFCQSAPGGVSVFALSDDADPEDDYSLCVFEDGLNHYTITAAGGTFPNFGLVVNDLTTANTITIVTDTATWVAAAAIAVTGVVGDWPGNPEDPSLSWLFGAIAQESEQPVGGGGSSAVGCAWDYGPGGGAIEILSPVGATDTDWDWVLGELAFYALQSGGVSDKGPWTWTDGSITDFLQWDVPTGLGFLSFALGTGLVSPGGPAPSLGGVWGDATEVGAGQGFALASGAGPPDDCTTPPLIGNPVFNNHIRLSE